MDFKIHSKFQPTGDQPQAIDKIVENIENGITDQILLGVTGSGKTFTVANVIERINLLQHNYIMNTSNFSLKMPWNILFRIMIIISPKPI